PHIYPLSLHDALPISDMKLPIQLAMTWPERTRRVIEPLDFFSIRQLTFDKPDFRRFPCLELAREAARAGGRMPAVLNAADEIAVDRKSTRLNSSHVSI